MTWLLEQLHDSEFAQEHVFYIDGFPDFTRQHFAILEYLMVSSPCVTVSLNCDRAGSNLLAFEKAGYTASELIRSAKAAGVEVEIRYIAGEESNLTSVRQMLFQGVTEPDPSLKGHLSLCHADSRYRECKAAAKRILELVRSDSRYRQIGVVCADMAAYQNAKKQINDAIYSTFYHKETGMFEICDRQDINQYSVLANALGYLCGAVPKCEEERLLQSILHNRGNGKAEVIPATLSMHTFRYEALLKADRDRYKQSVLEEIDEVYSKMLMKGATSFWETEDALAYEDAASLCHGWSAMPVYYYNTLEECVSGGLKQ